MAVLWIITKGGNRPFELGDEPVTIGRGKNCDIRLEDGVVSKLHARIERDANGWRIQDLNSSNGTRIDGEKIQAARLAPGKSVRVGRTELLLDQTEIEEDAPEDQSFMTSVPAIPDDMFDQDGNLNPNFDADSPRTQVPELTDEDRKLRLIRLVGEAVVHVTSVSEVAAKILAIIIEETKADRGFVCLFEPDGSHVPIASQGAEENERKSFSRTVLKKMQEDKAGVLMRQSGDIEADASSLRAMAVQSTICVPLWTRHEIMGFLSLDILRSRRSFTMSHLELLVAVSHQASLGIERARLSDLAQNERDTRDYLSQYVDHKILQTFLSSDSLDDPLTPREQIVTVLFCDIVSFTKISETLPPTQLAIFIGDHLTAMTEILFEHGGTVDKYIGDAVMALFGAPLAADDDPARAVQAALAMREHVTTTAGRNVRLRFGIATGTAVVGNLGSSQRVEYTALGDTVNVASRLEHFARPNEIVIDEETKARLGDEFAVEEIGEIDVRNREQPVSVYKVWNRAE